MLSESERAIAIREGHRNTADAAYFNERPHLADDNGIRVFDAGFDRGWDAACAERDARIAELERQLEEARKDAELLDYIQTNGATVEIIPGAPDFYPVHFRVGGRYRTANENIRDAIRAAIKEQT